MDQTSVERQPVLAAAWPGRARRAAGLAVGAVLAMLLAGCGMTSMTSGVFGTSTDKVAAEGVTEAGMLAAAQSEESGTVEIGALATACPKFVIWPGDQTVTSYEPGRENDALGVAYRGELTKTARECTVTPGRITIKYGFSGRVLLGPRGKPGEIRLPVNVFVTNEARDKIETQAVEIMVVVSPDKPIGYFSQVQSVAFDFPEGTRPADYKLFVAFDKAGRPAG